MLSVVKKEDFNLEEKIIELYKKGSTLKGISKELDISFNQVTHRVKKLQKEGVLEKRIKRRKAKAKAKKKTQEQRQKQENVGLAELLTSNNQNEISNTHKEMLIEIFHKLIIGG